jgi:DNA-binding response OmpR family regulator
MGTPRKILVVDDDEAIREFASKVLRTAGYQVDTAANGLQALMSIDRAPPALVITDIMMPELDGLEFVEGLRHRAETLQLPVIFITASENPKHFAASVKLKARQYMQKPFTTAALLERVKRVLGEP